MNFLFRMAYHVAYRLLRTYWFILRPEHPSVHVAVWCGNRLLVIRNPYKPFECVPAGGLKRREEPAVAAARELEEEVGISVDSTELEFHGVVTSRQEFKKDLAHFFELVVDEEPPVQVDGREVAWARFIDSELLDQQNLSEPVLRYLAAREISPASGS